MKTPRKRTLLLKYIILAITVLLIGGAGYVCLFPNIWAQNEKTYLYIYEGDNFNDILNRLKKMKAVRNPYTFKWLAMAMSYPRYVQPGQYQLKPNMSNYRLLKRLKEGDQIPVRLTFNNIRTKEQLAKRLGEQLMIDSMQIVGLLQNDIFLQEYGFNPETVSAMFIPNTYEVYWNSTPTTLFKRMLHEYNKFWSDERKEKAEEMGLTPIEVSILASIVESESNRKDEKPIIAGLYINRLRKGMLLQTDPTVIFALNDFSLKRVVGVRKIDSPYNTYLYKGLPPGAIRIPSIESIDAVLNYEPNNYIYMCAKDDFSGYHLFTASFSEHEKNRKNYIRALNRRGIK